MTDKRDLILQFLIEHPNRYVTEVDIKKELFPDMEIGDISFLLLDIIDYEKPIVRNFTQLGQKWISVQMNHRTKAFLQSGGFTAINEKIESEQQESEEVKEMARKIQKLQIKNLKLDNWDIKFRWLIAVGSFIVGLISGYFL